MTVDKHVGKLICKIEDCDDVVPTGLGVLPGQSRWGDLANLREALRRPHGPFVPIRRPFHEETDQAESRRKSLKMVFDRSEAVLFLSGSSSMQAKIERDGDMTLFLKHISEQRTKRAPPAAICLHGKEHASEHADNDGDYGHIRFVDCHGRDLRNAEAAERAKQAILDALAQSRAELDKTERSLSK